MPWFRRAVGALLVPLAVSCADGHAAPVPSHEGEVPVGPALALRYRTFGATGDTVVLVAGGPAMPARYFEAAMAPIGKGRVLVSYDLRGRGASRARGDSVAIGLDEDVADLEQLRVALRIERLRLVGDNWGAVVAAVYAARHPDHVERVAMIAPFWTRLAWSYQLANFSADPTYMKRYLDATGARRDSTNPVAFCREFWPFLFAPLIDGDPAVRASLAPAMCDMPARDVLDASRTATRLMNSVGVSDVREQVRDVRAPVLLLAGYRNPIFAQMYGEWKVALPTARVDSVAAPAMFPWAIDPKRTYADLDTFLRGAWPAEAR